VWGEAIRRARQQRVCIFTQAEDQDGLTDSSLVLGALPGQPWNQIDGLARLPTGKEGGLRLTR
jgi:hypothetical protein